jgi:hypothetical protein
MSKHYWFDKEPQFGLDRVIIGPGVYEVLDSDFAEALKQEGVDRMLDAAYEAGLSARPVAAHSPGEAAHGAGLKTKAES